MRTKFYKRVICFGCGSHVEDVEVTEAEYDRLMALPLTRYVQEAGIKHAQVENLGMCSKCPERE